MSARSRITNNTRGDRFILDRAHVDRVVRAAAFSIHPPLLNEPTATLSRVSVSQSAFDRNGLPQLVAPRSAGGTTLIDEPITRISPLTAPFRGGAEVPIISSGTTSAVPLYQQFLTQSLAQIMGLAPSAMGATVHSPARIMRHAPDRTLPIGTALPTSATPSTFHTLATPTHPPAEAFNTLLLPLPAQDLVRPKRSNPFPQPIIDETALRVLDLPNMSNDFYLQLLDWSRDNGQLAVVVDDAVFSYNYATSQSTTICQLEDRIAQSEPAIPTTTAGVVVANSNLPSGDRSSEEPTTTATATHPVTERVMLASNDQGHQQALSWYNGMLRGALAHAAPDESITSVCWLKETNALNEYGTTFDTNLSIGTRLGFMLLYDANQQVCVGALRPHTQAITCQSAAHDRRQVLCGSVDGTVTLHDLRVPFAFAATLEAPLTFAIHNASEPPSIICNVQWCPLDATTFAVGTGSYGASVWDIRMPDAPLQWYRHEHRASVRGLAWSPHRRNLLATGGGTQDTVIRLWRTDIVGSTPATQVYTGSQVTTLAWSPYDNLLVSTQGYGDNRTLLWQYSDNRLVHRGTLRGHTDRVLWSALNPDGSMLATASPDETLLFWSLPSVDPKRLQRTSKSSAYTPGLPPAGPSDRLGPTVSYLR